MLTLAKRDFSSLLAEGAAHHLAGRLREAESAYRAALAISPGHASVRHNLGVIAAQRGESQAAIGWFDAAIALEPGYAAAHFNRALALQSLGRSRAAIEAFTRACTLDAGCYDAHRALGFLWLAQGERGRALDHFARTYELRRGDDRSDLAKRSLTTATRGKLLHDAEQLTFLSTRLRDGKRFATLARAYATIAAEVPEEGAELSREQMLALGDEYNTAIHVCAAPELDARAVSERRDRSEIVRRLQEHRAVYFEALLTPQALLRLRRYLLESTIWHDFSHIGGFVASYLEDGLACPLLLQIADEIRRSFPEVLEKRPLSQAWAFKALNADAAVGAHADDGVVSINFWVTPDEANRDPERGGLRVCRAPSPEDWQINGYDADRTEIADFMARHVGQTLDVPYRENRAVLFESRLFHMSDAPRFASGYESHRINVTMLFGRHDS